MNEKCFACNKRLGRNPSRAITEDGAQIVYIGSECAKMVYKSQNGYQPPLGGPKLYGIEMEREVKIMKRFAVLDRNLTFNNLEDWFKKDSSQWVEQKRTEGATVRAFEKKYCVTLEYRAFPDSDKYKGWFIKVDEKAK